MSCIARPILGTMTDDKKTGRFSSKYPFVISTLLRSTYFKKLQKNSNNSKDDESTSEGNLSILQDDESSLEMPTLQGNTSHDVALSFSSGTASLL